MIKIYFLFLIFIVSCKDIVSIRVCNTFFDYFSSDSKECYNTPEGEFNITQVITHWGFRWNTYSLETKDNYTLLLVRAYKNETILKKSIPIILGHGLYMNSLGFCSNRNRSVGHFLINHNFDVWLINFRGTVYSKKHKFLKPYSTYFWEYSFHEMGVYDLDVILKKVYKITNKRAIYYGYSMGTTASFVYSSTFPKLAQKYLKGIIATAPEVYFSNIPSYLRTTSPLLELLYNYGRSYFGGYLKSNDVINKTNIELLLSLMKTSTQNFVLTGIDISEMDPETIPIYSAHSDVASVKVLAHYAQIIKYDKFQQFDYGVEDNMKLYEQKNPPLYNISKINVPVALFIGRSDYISSEKDTKRFYCELNPSSRCGYNFIRFQNYNHNDFAYARNIDKHLLHPVLATIQFMEDDISCSEISYLEEICSGPEKH